MLPSDTEAPMFAYGLFRSNQIGILRLHSFIEKIQPDIKLKGIIYERDGLPILEYDENRGHKVNGDLIYFKRDSGRFAYASISEIEPENQYRWEPIEIEVDSQSISANVLVGRSPTKGSVELGEQWDTWNDPLLTNGKKMISENLKKLDKFPDPIDEIIHIQITYLLLWSVIERYVTLRWGLHDNIRKKLLKFAEHDLFKSKILELINETRDVYDSRNPSHKKHVLNPHNPKKCIDYYYQIRSNSIHRGKSCFVDIDLLKPSINELFEIFFAVVQSDQDKAKRLSSSLIENGPN